MTLTFSIVLQEIDVSLSIIYQCSNFNVRRGLHDDFGKRTIYIALLPFTCIIPIHPKHPLRIRRSFIERRVIPPLHQYHHKCGEGHRQAEHVQRHGEAEAAEKNQEIS